MIAGPLPVIVDCGSKGSPHPRRDSRRLGPEVLGTDSYQPIKAISRQLSLLLVVKLSPNWHNLSGYHLENKI